MEGLLADASTCTVCKTKLLVHHNMQDQIKNGVYNVHGVNSSRHRPTVHVRVNSLLFAQGLDHLPHGE
jgi:hypothetical protein